VPSRDLSFPLVSRSRPLGVPFGAVPSRRRGIGSDVAGSHPYQPGDDVGAIDWNASARLSAAHDADEFIVRDRFADEAPRVVAFCDRRAAMTLYPPGLPWLRKAEAMRIAFRMIATSAERARGVFGYLDLADAGEPFWDPPTRKPNLHGLDEEYGSRPFSAAPDSLQQGLEFLRLARIGLPPGSFVFVLSDFLVTTSPDTWLAATQQAWEMVPVVIQDPTWEQSFPDVSGLMVPIVDAESGKVGTMRLRRSQAHGLRSTHEQRLRRLLEKLASLGAEPVLVGSTDEEAILQAFLAWADRRTELAHEWQLTA